ncbi:MAG: helix-turn-helix domain-containing protein [Gammaproteobacteria bacterium]
MTKPVRRTTNYQDGAVRSETACQSCRSCQHASQCLPGLLTPDQVQQFERGLQRCRSLAPGEHLFRAGDSVRSLYAVQAGSLKSYMVDNEGREHITSFHFCGEIMGIDAIYPARHPSSCIALAVSRVCVLPYATLTLMAQKIPELQTQIFRLFSREVLGYSALAGDFSAEERLATFLVMVAARQTNTESTDLELAMARQDIANYLRLSPETLSRILARFQKKGLVKADRKRITLLDVEGLAERAACMNPYARCGRRHDVS